MVGARPSTSTPSPDPLSLNEPASEAEDMIIIQSRPRREPPTTSKSGRKDGVSVKTPMRTPDRRKRKAESEEEGGQDGAGGESSTAAAASALKRNPSKRVKKSEETLVASTSKPRARAAQAKVSKAVSKLDEGNNGGSSNKTATHEPETDEGLRTPRKRAVPKKYDDNILTPQSGRKVRIPKAQPVKPAGSGRKSRASIQQVDPATVVEEEGSSSGSEDQDPNSDEDDDDDEDAFELDSKTSRAKFLENERRRKLNGARNFVFTGDANEARRTRSGKAVVAVETDVEDEEIMDDKVGNEMAVDGEQTGAGAAFEDGVGDENMEIDLGVDIDYTGPEDLQVQDHPTEPRPPPPAEVNQVSPYIQARLNTILTKLSAPPSWNPAPFATEGPENEALTSLVNLLRGTIERGEGNSCLVVGSKGSGKSRTVNRAIQIAKLKPTSNLDPTPGHEPKPAPNIPIIVRLNGLAQTNDMLAIREMGRQIAQQEGQDEEVDEEEETNLVVDASAPTTLPSHLLTFLTASSARSIIVIIEGFDLFTEHARQALLYCLLDVVQSVRTGPVESTGRGVAVIGVTSRVDTPLLLEKRVKSRFSQRIFRVVSPLALDGGSAWKNLLESALFPSDGLDPVTDEDEHRWIAEWVPKIQMLLANENVITVVSRLCSLTTDPRLLYRPFAQLIADLLVNPSLPLTAETVVARVQGQTEGTGWGKKLEQLHGLSQPDLVILIIAKHFSYAGKEEFNFAMAEHEYNRFARTELAASGRTKWSGTTLQAGWEHLLSIGLIFPATRFRPNTNPHMQRFIMCRSLLTRSEIIGFFKGEGGKMLSTELVNWGRMAGGHA